MPSPKKSVKHLQIGPPRATLPVMIPFALPPATAPDITRPAPDRVIAGDPVHTTWNSDEGGGLHVGQWQSTPGTWRVHYDEWEYFHIRQGHSILTPDGGMPIHLRPGDALVIRSGTAGVWETVETTLKEYVIRLDAP